MMQKAVMMEWEGRCPSCRAHQGGTKDTKGRLPFAYAHQCTACGRLLLVTILGPTKAIIRLPDNTGGENP
jgi:hypothetical protein